MRLWSLHPKYLDAIGLVALWREALLAQAVLANKTYGYRKHPQLNRFKETTHPLSSIAQYLEHVFHEASVRGYSFDRKKIMPISEEISIPVSSGQIRYEWKHLMKKLNIRNPEICARWGKIRNPGINPLFSLYNGGIESWERTE
jgi:hypothetical protein